MTIVKAAPDTATEKTAPTVQAKKSPLSRKTVQPRKISGKPKTKPTWIREQCTKADLSVLMGISMRTLTDMNARGLLVRAPKTGLYLTVPTLEACWAHYRGVAADRSREMNSPLAIERVKTLTVERQILEIALDKLKSEILTLDEVKETWSTFASQLKAVMLTVPGEARTRIPHLTAHDQETLRNLVKDMLVDLAAEVDASVIGGSGKDLID